MNSGLNGLPGRGRRARISLRRQAFGDTNGLFYFLGTRFGTQPWSNPMMWERDPQGNAVTMTDAAGFISDADTARLAPPFVANSALSTQYGNLSSAARMVDRRDTLCHTNNDVRLRDGENDQSGFIFCLPDGCLFRCAEFTFRNRPDITGAYQDRVKLRGYVDSSCGRVLATLYSPTKPLNAWFAAAGSNDVFCRMFSVTGWGNAGSYFMANEIELYGDLIYPQI